MSLLKSSVVIAFVRVLASFCFGVLIFTSGAEADSLTISVDGVLPSTCEVTLTYHDGDKNKSVSCTVKGNDNAHDADYKCNVDNGSIGHLNDGSSWAEVGISSETISGCVSHAGFTLSAYSGNGSGSSNFDIKNWKKGNSGDGNDCVDDFFGKKASSPTYGTYWQVARFAGANGKLVDGQVMQSFQMNVSKDSSSQDHYKKVTSCQRYIVQ